MTARIAATADRLHPMRLREVYGAFPTGVTVLSALVDGAPVGMTANSFTTVSLDPPLVSVCAAHTSSTWPLLRGSERIGVSVLGADQGPLCRQLAGPADQRFDGVDWRAPTGGAVLLDASAAWLECSLHAEVVAGDHVVALLDVHDLDRDPAADPLVFHGSRFRSIN